MSDHVMVFEFDRDCVRARMECRAAPDADCRLVGPDHCDCESWTIERADSPVATPFHRVETFGGAEVIHWMRPGGECNVCLFVNELPEESAAPGQRFTLAEVPVTVSWEIEDYSWTREGEDR